MGSPGATPVLLLPEDENARGVSAMGVHPIGSPSEVVEKHGHIVQSGDCEQREDEAS